ncbi:hypothetical protein [Desertibaculum subflavum]|uniref:hypothetical protein n=1 Tax=Desertibaculum subflavum TaxID=2268458 RepID=UPI0013C4F788
MVRSALRSLGRFFLGLSSPPPAKHSPPAAQATAAASFEGRTRQIARVAKDGSSKVLAASVQLIGMQDIRRSLGPRWPAVSSIAYAVAESAIRSHLSAQDIFQRQDDETFILCFAHSSPAEADRQTRAIVNEIRTELVKQAPDIPLRVDHTVAELDWAPVVASGGSLADSIAASLRKIRQEADEAARTWRRELLASATVHYNPVWKPDKRIVAIYRCLLDPETGRQTLRRFGALSGLDEARSLICDLDCLLIGRAIETLHRLISSGGTAQLIIPVNLNALADRAGREAYLGLCRTIPEAYRPYVLFELHGVTAATPTSRLIEIGLALKPHAHGLLIEVPPVVSRLHEAAAISVYGVTVSAKALNGPDIGNRLQRFAAAARAMRIKIFAHDVDTLGTCEAAIGAQLDYMGGAAIAPSLLVPKSAHFWNPV